MDQLHNSENELGESIEVLGKTRISREDYLSREGKLEEIFARPDCAISLKVLLLYHHVLELLRARLNNRDEKPLDVSSVSGLAGDPGKARLLRGFFLAFLQEAAIKGGDRSRWSFVFSFLSSTFRFSYGWGSERIPLLGDTEVALNSVDGVAMDWNDRSLTEPVLQYLRMMAFKARLFTRHGLFKGTGLILIAFSLGIWYSRFSARAEKKEKVESEHLSRGLGAVELFVVQEDRGVHQLIETGWFGVLFEMLMARPAVASSLVQLATE